MYDNGYIEIDPAQCGYTTFLGSSVPVPSAGVDTMGASDESVEPQPQATAAAIVGPAAVGGLTGTPAKRPGHSRGSARVHSAGTGTSRRTTSSSAMV